MYAGKRLTKASKKGNPARYNFSVMSIMTKTSDLGYLIRVVPTTDKEFGPMYL